ncbi:DUF4351 domain-containing protein [Allohahella sp. A8]|uniref:DUF4351 domain-containing protein n=1 Tax=Allohahella sp. A8 TaxID=3141461 RepID=UPI003A811C3E
MGEGLSAIQNLSEMHAMLSERAKEWSHLHREAGFREGLEKGLERGEARVLKRLLTRRFGDLSQALVQQIDNASEKQLETWADRLLDAESVEEIFA